MPSDGLYVEAQSEGWKDYYVRVVTNTSNNPDDAYLGRKLGNASWGVPADFEWETTSGVETTTTRVARRYPLYTEDCTARIRHDRLQIFVIDVIGRCV